MYNVVIRKIDTKEVVKEITKEPVTMEEAESIERGTNINLNHKEYVIAIVQA